MSCDSTEARSEEGGPPLHICISTNTDNQYYDSTRSPPDKGRVKKSTFFAHFPLYILSISFVSHHCNKSEKSSTTVANCDSHLLLKKSSDVVDRKLTASFLCV